MSNVAICAKHILHKYPHQIRKIVILDWDVHFGDGTQRAIEGDDRIHLISIHRHNHGLFYPNLLDVQAPTYTGAVPTQIPTQTSQLHPLEVNICNNITNIGWNHPHPTNGDYAFAFESCILPLLRASPPDLILISAGFDSAEGDPLGKYVS